jgi:hypothetical protein
VLTGVLERDPGSGNEVLDRARNENLARPCERRDAGADVHCESSHPLALDLAFTGMQADADADAQITDLLGDDAGTADRSCGAIECGEEAVSRGIDLVSPKAGELSADDAVVAVEYRGPGAVAQLGDGVGRPDDVGEHDGLDLPVDVGFWRNLGQKPLDRAGYRVDIAKEWEDVRPRQFLQHRSRNPAGQIPRLRGIAAATRDQRRNGDRRQNVSDVRLSVEPQLLECRAWARASTDRSSGQSHEL